MELMHQCDARIRISESTRRRVSQLRAVFTDIRNNRCSLEIVGASNLCLRPENDLIIAVKVIVEGSNSGSTIHTTQPESE